MHKKVDGWGYVYRESTGELVSEGTIIADPLPAGLALFELPFRHDGDSERWGAEARRIVPYTNSDRIAELRSQRGDLATEIIRLEAAEAESA